MPVLFMGGEPLDFTPFGNVSWTNAYGRAGFSRGALKVDRQSTAAPFANEWVADFRMPATDFWTSWYLDGAFIDLSLNPNRPSVGWRSADNKVRVALAFDNEFRVRLLQGTDTGFQFLASSEHPNGWQAEKRFDVYIKMNGANSRVKVFVESVLHLDYTGPLGETEITKLSLGNGYGWAGGWPYYSEIFATTFDSRSLSLKTHYPTANGPVMEWDGDYSDVDEPDWRATSDVITTETSPKIASFEMNDLPGGQQTVRAFKMGGVFTRGVDALPHSVRLGVSMGGAFNFSDEMEVETGTTWLNRYMENNPITGMTWTQEDINMIQIAVRSEGYVPGELPSIVEAEFEGVSYSDEDFAQGTDIFEADFTTPSNSGQSFTAE